MPLNPEQGTALHEAGHAVAFARLRIRFDTVELLRDDPLGRGGGVFGPPVDLHTRRDRFLAALLAGSLAESAFTGRTLHDIAATCGGVDFKLLAEITEHMTPREIHSHARRAERFIDRNSWPIAAVAASLLQRRVLTEDDVHTIIKQGGRHDAAAA